MEVTENGEDVERYTITNDDIMTRIQKGQPYKLFSSNRDLVRFITFCAVCNEMMGCECLVTIAVVMNTGSQTSPTSLLSSRITYTTTQAIFMICEENTRKMVFLVDMPKTSILCPSQSRIYLRDITVRNNYWSFSRRYTIPAARLLYSVADHFFSI